jgi:hypothetical protein
VVYGDVRSVHRVTSTGVKTLWKATDQNYQIRELDLAGNWVLVRLLHWDKGGSLIKVPLAGGAHEVVFESFGDDEHFAGDGDTMLWSDFHAIYRMEL